MGPHSSPPRRLTPYALRLVWPDGIFLPSQANFSGLVPVWQEVAHAEYG
jgi:hypothetical protein